MGGCRCSYKNCTLRTDGVTHMFHYPVFDKVRCHQWLTNGQKLEFLNLKVSQLKNRVVCQHHFKDDNFMNFLKDKLTFDAVPTEDGPYCDSSQIADKNPQQDDSKLYTISLEDIENEYLTFNDKKANFSVKYGDFLTNCDLMDLDSLNLTKDNTQIVSKDKSYEENCDIILKDNIDRRKPTTGNPILNTTLDTVVPQTDSVYTIHVTEVPIETDKRQTNVVHPYVSVDTNAPQLTDQENNIQILTHKAKEFPKKKITSKLSKEKKITILDEQKISESVPLPGKLELVSPSTILPLPKRKRNLNQNLADADKINVHNINTNIVVSDLVEKNNVEQNTFVAPIEEMNNVELVNNSQTLDTTKRLGQSNRENLDQNVRITRQASPPKTRSNTKALNTKAINTKAINTKTINTKTVITKKSNSLLKNRIPPERIAAIEEKRKFNMKLRDIVASCLDKLDDEEDKLKSNREKDLTNKVSSYLSKDPELPSVHDYTVSYLEARMKKMENILLHKIDQNSQRIMELKQSFTPASKNKSVYTQTNVNEELTKKHLYHEISKYLSPETNSLLYEELFINKYVPNMPQCPPTKKRKYR